MQEKNKESELKGPGFELPPEGAPELNHNSTGVLEYWSNVNRISGPLRIALMIDSDLN